MVLLMVGSGLQLGLWLGLELGLGPGLGIAVRVLGRVWVRGRGSVRVIVGTHPLDQRRGNGAQGLSEHDGNQL